MKTWWLATLVIVGLAACSEPAQESSAEAVIEEMDAAADGAPYTEFGFAEAREPGIDPFGAATESARSTVVSVARRDGGETSAEAQQQGVDTSAGAQIAYTYGYGFQIEGDKIAQLQKAHVALCEELGESCRVLRLSEASTDGWDGYGELRLEVAASDATGFAEGLSEPAEALGGELVSTVRDGEDLSENIIDTEARLQSRLILRDKLTDILRNNRGSVDELVKAEQAVANVNEEIDATRSKLAEYRGRIRFSEVRIEYQPSYGSTQLGLVRPVMTAARSIGTTLGMTIATIIYVLTAMVPITIVLLGLRWILHRFGLRIRFWRKEKPDAA